ncbi:spermatogenesis-associated protein 22 isoform X3 [Alosa alosa]|uniref:spermatogenesis-associated protein 22 isoform X3 n=1 Tax=Alosa alosa TaxID=278164 RepID=UPI0020151313|nr:spermatogenesis-associated protein 22 isoform X3 [Alosa alosa]
MVSCMTLQGGNIVYFRDTMKRTETHPRPTAGCLSVPLFNQRQKRSRLPLTSNPTENELCSAIDFNDDFADSSFLSGNMAYTQSHAQSQSQRPPVPVAPRSQWNHQPQQLSNQPARYPGTPVRGYAPVPHPHKPANTWSQHSAPGTAMPIKQGQSGSSYGRGIVHHSQVNMQSKPKPPNHQPHSVLGRQETFVPTNQRQTGTAYGQGNVHHSQVNMQSKPKPLNHQQLTVQQSLSRQTHGSGGVRQGGVSFSGPRFPPAAPEPQKQAPQWKFKSSSQCGPTKKVMIGFNATQPTLSQQGEMRPKSQQQKCPVLQMKSVSEKTLRILTVVIEGMRHWSQFKNKAPMLFELFVSIYLSSQRLWTQQSRMGSTAPSIFSCGQGEMLCPVFSLKMTTNFQRFSGAWCTVAWEIMIGRATPSPACQSGWPPATSRRIPRRLLGHRTKK